MRSRLKPLLLLSLVHLGLTSGSVFAEVPSWLGGRDEIPRWVSASEAISDENVRWDLLPEEARRTIQRQLEMARNARLSGEERTEGDPCWAWYSTKDIEPEPLHGVSSPQHLAELSKLMIVGTVTDSALGFYEGWPATVFEVTIEQSLRLPDSMEEVPTEVYVVTLGARIPVGNDYLCFKSSPVRSGPALGRRLLLALERVPDLVHDRLIWPGDHEIFVDTPEGSVAKSARYTSKTTGTSFDDFVLSMAQAGADQ